ncbi:MAG: hypothetical protein AAFU57_12010 [Bacteroidota bacterium]
MKQTPKTILALILIFLGAAQLLLYQSEWNFEPLSVYQIVLLNLIVSLAFIFRYFKKLWSLILLTIVTISIAIVILVFELSSSFSGTEKHLNSWEIEQYDVILAKEEYVAGPGSEPYLKLRKRTFFSWFYKDIDRTEAKSSTLKIGKSECLVSFEKTKLTFDLCEMNGQ